MIALGQIRAKDGEIELVVPEGLIAFNGQVIAFLEEIVEKETV